MICMRTNKDITRCQKHLHDDIKVKLDSNEKHELTTGRESVVNKGVNF